jgi:transcriptional regulator with XRE-family HTH domain
LRTQDIIRMLRNKKGLTQEKIAELLDMPRSTYAKWELEVTPDYSDLKKLAKFHGVSVDYLLNGEPLKVSEDGVPYIVMSPEEMELFAEIKQLSEEDKTMIYSLVNHLRRKKGVNEEAAGSDNIRPFRHQN